MEKFRELASRTASVVIVLVSAMVWLSISLTIAFPSSALSFDLNGLMQLFVSETGHALFLMILIGIDIGIALFVLQDERIREAVAGGRRIAVMFFVIVAFAVTALALPIYNKPLCDAHPFGVGMTSLILAGILRAMSYCTPQSAKQLPPPALRPPRTRRPRQPVAAATGATPPPAATAATP